MAGSSPLTRGKRRSLARFLDGRGLIPAHAGKTPGRMRALSSRWAHPRSRGENWLLVAVCVGVEGSSPLTRGKPGVCPSRATSSGLIPAHAGKTYAISGLLPVVRAHPRSRGENRMIAGAGVLVLGSSPLTRGKPHLGAYLEVRLRLIPAHAGKTYAIVGLSPVMRAHPRSRGENFAAPVSTSRHLGSSPLTRGKPPRPDHRRDRGRLIPAHAGKTQIASMSGRSLGAHPRSRGENFAPAFCRATKGGSSPLTRGKRLPAFARFVRPGLIPAHAGKTAPNGIKNFADGAHPRSRGENGRRDDGGHVAAGSSPLTRGKREARALLRDRCGAHPRSRGENQLS